MYKDGAEMATGVQDISADGLPVGFIVTVDTNGVKGPNVLSNCKSTGATKTGADDSASTADTCKGTNKNTRYIADRFQLRNRGNVVEPVGAAASGRFVSLKNQAVQAHSRVFIIQ